MSIEKNELDAIRRQIAGELVLLDDAIGNAQDALFSMNACRRMIAHQAGKLELIEPPAPRTEVLKPQDSVVKEHIRRVLEDGESMVKITPIDVRLRD